MKRSNLLFRFGRYLALISLGFIGLKYAGNAFDQSPNVVLITIDTLRADHLSLYGYDRNTSPNLDKFAKEGIWFDSCYSQSATTGASHAALFTSRYPQSNGVLANREKFPAFPSLMDALRKKGYIAGGFVSSIVVGKKFGIQQDFDHFNDHLPRAELNRPFRGERPARETLSAALTWLQQQSSPFFLWVHLIDPHGPYQPPENPDRYVGDSFYNKNPEILEISNSDWDISKIPTYQNLNGHREAAFYIARYDAEIRYTDEALGSFFAALRKMNAYDSTIIVVTSDHGETLTEKGHKRYFSHGAIAYEEVVRVPLMIKGVKTDGRHIRKNHPVRLIDVVPTLLSMVGMKGEKTFQGRNLFEEIPRDEPVFSFGAYGSDFLEKQIGTQFTVLKGDWRYIRNSLNHSEELYDHRQDPAEERNLIGIQGDTGSLLKKELDSFFNSFPRVVAEPIEMSPEHLESLRALGYVN